MVRANHFFEELFREVEIDFIQENTFFDQEGSCIEILAPCPACGHHGLEVRAHIDGGPYLNAASPDLDAIDVVCKCQSGHVRRDDPSRVYEGCGRWISDLTPARTRNSHEPQTFLGLTDTRPPIPVADQKVLAQLAFVRESARRWRAVLGGLLTGAGAVAVMSELRAASAIPAAPMPSSLRFVVMLPGIAGFMSFILLSLAGDPPPEDLRTDRLSAYRRAEIRLASQRLRHAQGLAYLAALLVAGLTLASLGSALDLDTNWLPRVPTTGLVRSVAATLVATFALTSNARWAIGSRTVHRTPAHPFRRDRVLRRGQAPCRRLAAGWLLHIALVALVPWSVGLALGHGPPGNLPAFVGAILFGASLGVAAGWLALRRLCPLTALWRPHAVETATRWPALNESAAPK